MPEQIKILILGLGSEILRDDGIGPRLARDLRAHFTSQQFHFKSSTVGGLEILDLIRGFQMVFIIDGMKSKETTPANVYFMGIDDFRETLHLSNIHDTSFHTTLKLGKELEDDISDNISIIGIGIEEDMEFGETFTPKLDEEYVNILELIHQFILERFRELSMSTPLNH